MAIHHNGKGAETPSGVRLENNRLHFNRITVESATAAELLRRFPPDEWVGVVGRMVDHGAGALESAYTSSTAQLVSHQLETAVAEMQAAMSSTFMKDWTTASEKLNTMLAEHEKALTTGLGKYLDSNSKTGVQAQMTEVFDRAGATLFANVARAFEEGDETALSRYLAKFSTEVQKGFTALASQVAVRHHTETATALAGVVYEEATLVAIAEMARACGDVPERCAAALGQLRRRSGDIVVGINEDLSRGADLRLVFELKRRAEGAQAFGMAGIRTSLRMAKENRAAQAGVFLVEDVGLLPAIGGGFVELGHGDYATVYTPGGTTLGLSVAYRLARLTVLADAFGNGGDQQIDMDAAQRAVTEVRQGMARLEHIRTQHASAIGAINRATTGVQELVDSVLSGLRRLDDILRG